MRPGEHPATRLCELLDLPAGASVHADAVAAVLAHRGPRSSLLIVIDQLEELFTLARGNEQEPFLAILQT
jgi:hypothetical protein